MRSLAVDIGNTRTKAAVFDNDSVIGSYTPESGSLEVWMRAAIHQHAADRMILSSTAAIPEFIGQLGLSQTIVLDHDTPLPIRLDYDTPATLGRDRIAGIAGAHHIWPTKNVFVVDAGTCVTYDLVTAEGVFKGGNIAPGLDMRLRSMHEFTAMLPLVDRPGIEGFLGRSTTNALQFGAEKGILLEIEGYIRRLDKEYGNLAVVLTGGDGAYFAGKLKTEIFVRPNLVLVGLNEILRYNGA